MHERRRLLANTPGGGQLCAVPWCTQAGDSPHEPLTRARGGSITDDRNIIMVCHLHNQALTGEPAWAYVLGLLAHSWGAPDWAAELARYIDASAGEAGCWRWTGQRNHALFGVPWFRGAPAWLAVRELAAVGGREPECNGLMYCVNPAHAT